jgi:hypothetical protein
MTTTNAINTPVALDLDSDMGPITAPVAAPKAPRKARAPKVVVPDAPTYADALVLKNDAQGVLFGLAKGFQGKVEVSDLVACLKQDLAYIGIQPAHAPQTGRGEQRRVAERPELEQRSLRAIAVPQGDSQDKSRHFVGLDTGLSFVKVDGTRVHLPLHTILTAMSTLRGRPSSHRLNISALPFVPNAKLADKPTPVAAGFNRAYVVAFKMERPAGFRRTDGSQVQSIDTWERLGTALPALGILSVDYRKPVQGEGESDDDYSRRVQLVVDAAIKSGQGEFLTMAKLAERLQAQLGTKVAVVTMANPQAEGRARRGAGFSAASSDEALI